VCIGALKERLPAWWSSSANPQGRSLGARDSDAGPMLVEERAALLTQLVVRRMRLADSGKEVHGALVCQEIQEPHKLPMQAAGGRRDQGQESLSILQVVEAVVLHLALGSVDEGAIGVLSMPKRSVATDVVAGAVELMDHGDVDDQVSLVSDVCIPNLEVASPSPAAGGDVATLGAKARCANDLLHHG